jgi:outer membrane protein OmpA-like peptidoglycan-associated protein
MHSFHKFDDSNVRSSEPTRYADNGSVAIYSLDSKPADVFADEKKPAPVTSADGGMAIPGREDVTVYPFEDDLMVAAMAPGPEASAPAAPQPIAPVVSNEGFESSYTTMPAHEMEPDRIYFANGSAAIDAAGHQAINNAAGAARGADMVSVEGHASAHTVNPDPVTSRIINLKISMERAFNVAKELIRRGVPANMIRTTAWGDARPALPVDGMSAEDASRRVEIYANGASPHSH